MTANNENTIQIVKKIFTEYLERNNQRKTIERFLILEEIYQRNDHFDVDSLYNDLIDKKIQVSRATLYNTLELLVACDLVTKHQFGKNIAQFEKSYGYRQHDHIICLDCGHVTEFCDPRLQQIQMTISDVLKFDIKHHSLNMYGSCSSFKETGTCKNKSTKN